jgi:hypothetical protein
MKRFALAWSLLSMVAAQAAAQSDSSRVILKGVSSSAPQASSSLAPEPIAPTSAYSFLTGARFQQEAAVDKVDASSAPAPCDGCGQDLGDCCCPSGCGLRIFADWLYLQPRGADAVYAARALNCFDPPLDVEQIDFGAFSNYRVGFAKTLHNDCTELGATFWSFEAQEEDHATRTVGTDVILPLLLHPSQIDCPGTTSTLARASAGIDFDRINIDYKQYCDWNCTQFDWLIGFGYAKLEQDLRASYDENSIQADSDLHGYGLRLGGGASRSWRWLSGFLHADFTLLATNINANYRSVDVFDGTEVDFDQGLDRLVPVLDLEAGIAMNVSCHTTIKVGYIYSIWWNVVTNQAFIEDVQQGDITGNSGDTLTFDGVFARVEFNF